ncbi:MAG: CocE/NonD family hydrolase [Paracoccaceae bacterium]|nr:CocE/NonD family hydrolase [Paracoccaceae bacterium]
MRDGCVLSARVWLPKNANSQPVPAILEHLPYRKRDGTASRDSLNHSWFAKNGYACVRTDTRGNGDSQGLMADEYLQQELDDAVDTINWLVEQPWCSGKIGMMGISWGGFNSLQVAAMRPDPLKAIITVCSSVDRFADDIHYKGGCLLGVNFTWAGRMLSYSSRPPDPKIFGEDWRYEWIYRLKNIPLLADTWLLHQKRDEYWQHGSVCEDYGSIKAAVLAVGGWHDGYRNTVSKLVSNLESPVKGILGPWNHRYPHLAEPEPKIGFLQEALRWWDKWLKNIDTNVENDPDYRLYIMDSVKPQRRLKLRPGEWKSIDSDFKQVIPLDTLLLGNGILGADEKIRPDFLEVPSGNIVGTQAGEFFPYNFGPELPADQISDDEKSLCFDGMVLKEGINLIGAPLLNLVLSSDKPLAQLAIRLCDLRPDGTSALITHGFINLTMVDSFEEPKELEIGKRINVGITLDHIAYFIPKGHRFRLAISSSYWPFIWPSPELTKIKIFSGSLNISKIDISKYEETNILDNPVTGEPSNCKIKSSPTSSRKEFFDKSSESRVVEVKHDSGCFLDLDHGLETDSFVIERWTIKDDDPLSARIDIDWFQSLKRKDWLVSTRSKFMVKCDNKSFFIEASIFAYEGDKEVFEKSFKEIIDRKFV